MARIRTIKPEFPQSESMGRVSRESRLCFILLFTLADDAGRLRGNSRMLASLLYPYDDDARKHIDAWLSELSNEGCISCYAIDGDQYIEILQWHKHQKIDKPTASKIPPAPEIPNTPRSLANPREVSSEDLGRYQGMDQESKRESAPSGADERFEEFWKAYPKKVGKDAAKKSFDKRRPSKAVLQEMLVSIEDQRKTDQWRKDGGQFIPNPATWLNQGRWKDGESDRAPGGLLPGAI